jgi:hypothetical protein
MELFCFLISVTGFRRLTGKNDDGDDEEVDVVQVRVQYITFRKYLEIQYSTITEHIPRNMLH